MDTSIGELLKKERIQRHASLEQVSQATHIRVRFLEALENEQLDLLPSRVQGRGFLRLYADYLGLPVQPLLDFWDGKSPLSSSEQLESETSVASQDKTLEAEMLANKITDRLRNFEETSHFQRVYVNQPLFQQNQQDEDILPSGQIFITIGQKLKQHREALGISRTDVERYIHVRPYFVEAIENGQFHLLPSSVHARGMLKNYATFLELDSEQFLLEFAEGLQTQYNERMLDRKSKKHPPIALAASPRWKLFLTPDLLIGSAIIFVLLVISLWSVSQVVSMRTKELNPTILPMANVLLETSSSPMATPSVTTTFFPSSTPGQSDDTNITESRLETGPDSAALLAPVSPTIPVADSAAPLQIYVFPSQRAWMRITSDDAIVFNGRVVPGNAYQFSGRQKIVLLTGNAAALQVMFNQEDIGTLGIVGQVVEISFSQEGIKTPTLVFSPTPTEPPPVTLTLEPTATVATPSVTPLIPQAQ